MIPTMRTVIPPPPKRKNLWERYSSGENLKPTYSKRIITSKMPPPPQMPRSVTQGGLDLQDKIIFSITLIIILTIGIYCSFFYKN